MFTLSENMGTARYCISVSMPDRMFVDGVQITAINRDAWASSVKTWSGITKDGIYCWEHLDTGLNGDKYDFGLRYVDERGIEWRGSFSDRIFSNGEKKVVLRQVFLDEDTEFTVPPYVENYLIQQDEGKEILAAMKELAVSIKNGMSHAALCLSTYILEGIIILKARIDGVWSSEFEGRTFGALLGLPKVKQLLPSGVLNKAEAINKLRLPGAHFKDISTSINEAKVAVALIKQLCTDWFKPPSTNGEQS